MTLKAGARLGPYEIGGPLGAGGMGEVYRATDTRLHRTVAIKVLPSVSAADPDSRHRFEREAHAVAALTHSHICTLHDIGHQDGVDYLVMEYLEGETLAQRLNREGGSRDPLRLDQVLRYATEIADALDTAHRAGLVHRDLKPSNVMLTKSGAKLLDFGLAKTIGRVGLAFPAAAGRLVEDGSQVSLSATAALVDARRIAALSTNPMSLTAKGVILGTLQYMAPEQLEGKAVDGRTDIFALGVVIYEMATGQKAFTGDSQASLIAAILSATPPAISTLQPLAPPALEHVVTVCLAKDPDQRWQTAADLKRELQWIADDPSKRIDLPIITRWKNHSPRAAVALGLVAAGTWGYLTLTRTEPGASVPQLANPIQVAASAGTERDPSWSPDGHLLAYSSDPSGDSDIWVTQVVGGTPVNRTADLPGGDYSPRWAPDGRQVAFVSRREGGGIFVMSALAGGARQIGPATNDIAGWSLDGSEVAYEVGDRGRHWLERRTLGDGTTSRTPFPGRTGLEPLRLTWSPNRRFVAYVEALNSAADLSRLWILRLSDGTGTAITDGRMRDRSPSWAPDSRTLYFVSNRGGTTDLWQQPLTSEGVLDGPSVQVTTGLELLDAVISPDGRRLAYTKGRQVANVWRVPILADRAVTWADAQQLTFDHAYIEHVDLSRDGQRLIVSSDRNGNPDLWMLPASGGEMQPLTTDPTPDWAPAWSPDGRQVAFYAYRSGNREIWIQPLDGGSARQVTRGEGESQFPRWSPDGKAIVFNVRTEDTSHIWVMPAAGGRPQQITSGPTFNGEPDWCPDGRWLAFGSERPGVRRVSITGGPEELITREGSNPRWAPDGQRIFFVAPRSYGPNVWVASLGKRSERAITDLAGKRGGIGSGFATDGRYLYFPWLEDLASDLWVMDVVPANR